MLSAVVESWFMLGKLGGFNSSNLQLFFRASEDISHTRYDMNDLDRKLPGEGSCAGGCVHHRAAARGASLAVVMPTRLAGYQRRSVDCAGSLR